MRRFPQTIALFTLITLGVTGCALFGKPAGPQGSFDEQQQKAFAAAAIVSIALCEDLKEQLKPSEVALAGAASLEVSAVMGDSVTLAQGQEQLKLLMGSNARFTKTLAAVVYSVGAFLPQQYKETVGLSLLRTAASNCASIFNEA